MAYDPGTARVVLFGGQASGALADTWEWDGARWLPFVGPAPGRRSRHAMAYCQGNARVVLFGGDVWTVGLGDDTWEWDGRSWQQRTPAASPPPRFLHAMAPDFANGSAVLFGGRDAGGARDDTWEWGGVSWRQRFPATRPPARSGHAMAYDAIRQRIVMFGGVDDNGLVANDTWEWDGTDWLRLPATASTPAARQTHCMTFDPIARRVVLNGGSVANGIPVGGTFTWDGATWTAQAPSNQRWGAAMDRDALGRIVRFGGSNLLWVDETWLYGLLVAADSRPVGSGCGAGPPRLTSGRPFLGNDQFALELSQALPRAACAFGLATASGSVSFGPCTYLLQGPTVVLPATTDALGRASLAAPIPLRAGLRGAMVYSQAVVVDPTSPPLGLAFSAGLALRLGD